MTFPLNDTGFTETILTAVSGNKKHGWQATRDDGWSFFIPESSPVIPKVGTKARIYESGCMIRGVFLDGKKVLYRTVEEEKEFRDIDMYGADAADWLKRWDDGKSVWSIEMGGLGPGYEQCIQIVAAETLRFWLDHKYTPEDVGGNKDLQKKLDDHLFSTPVVESLGLSGAQHGAGINLAWHILSKGPRGVMADDAVKDRKILVSKAFPQG